MTTTLKKEVTKELLEQYKEQGYEQVCIWPGTIIGEENIEDFTNWMKEELNADVKYLEEIKTLPTPGQPNTGGRNDAFFLVHKDSIYGAFSIKRLQLGILWLEDAIYYNDNQALYTQEVLDKYPPRW